MPFYNIKNIISKKPKIGLIFPRLNITPPYPLFLLIHITLFCNRKCSWCYQVNEKFYSSHNLEMEVNVFKKILSSFKLFKPHIHLYGGEPLLHPDFHLFLKYCQIYGYKPTLTTNGDYLDKYSQVIIHSSLSQLNLSINTLVNYNGDIDPYFKKKIKEFIEINRRKKIINLNYTIEPGSYNYIKDIILYFNNNYKKGDFAYFTIQHLMLDKIAKTKDVQIQFDSEKLMDTLMRIKKLNLKFKLLFLPNIKICDIENYYNSRYIFKNKCYVPWSGLSIYPDLTVTPGGGVLGCNFVLDSLGDSSIMEIWKGAQLNNFHSKLIHNGLPEICNRCCHKLYY